MLKKFCQNCKYFKYRVSKGKYNPYCRFVGDFIVFTSTACREYEWKPVKPLKGPWVNIKE